MNLFGKSEAEIQKEAREKVLAQFLQFAASEECPPGECPRIKGEDIWGCVQSLDKNRG